MVWSDIDDSVRGLMLGLALCPEEGAAMAARWIVPLTLLAACCVWASAAIAGEPPVPIEGMLLVTGFDLEGGTNYGHFLHGTSDTITPWPKPHSTIRVAIHCMDMVARQSIKAVVVLPRPFLEGREAEVDVLERFPMLNLQALFSFFFEMRYT